MTLLRYSVAIPTMNRPKELRQTLRRVVAQHPRPESVIIVDDGALNHVPYQKYIEKRDIRFVYHKKDKPGLVASLNIAIGLCESPWLLLLDDDILLARDYMQQVQAALSDHKCGDQPAAVVGYPILSGRSTRTFRFRLRLWLERLFFINGFVEGRRLPSTFCTDFQCGRHPNHPYRIDHTPGGLTLWRSEILRANPFDPWFEGYAYGNDKEIGYRVSRRYTVICHPAARALHLKSPGSRLPSEKLGSMKIMNQRYIHRRHGNPGLFSCALLYYALMGQILILGTAALFSQDRSRRLSEVSGMIKALFAPLPSAGERP